MRKKFLFLLPVLPIIVLLYSCGSGSGESTDADDSATAATDSAKAINNINQVQEISKKATPNIITNTLPDDRQVGPITYHLKALARDCIKTYHDHPELQAKPTTSVTFKQKDLQKWIDKMEGADSISIEWGLYTKPFLVAVNAFSNQLDELGSPYPTMDVNKRLNRLSVFLFAYKGKNIDGSPADYKPANNVSSAYNLGNLHP